MVVFSLQIEDFRNLQRLSLECSPHLNLIVGENAAGKTSFLEALYFLGRTRSFRTRQPRELIRAGATAFRIMAVVGRGDGGRQIPIGLERSAARLAVRIGGAPARSLAELASHLPVLLLNPDSHRLLEGGPHQRRRFMDWGLFHTAPAFLTVWQRYGAALRHRNAALRNGLAGRGIDAWDAELARAAADLDGLRQGFAARLQPALAPLVEQLLGPAALAVEYRRGWSQDQDLSETLRQGRDQDRRLGFTRHGPHRAELLLRLDARPALERLSRGQQKLLVIALVLAQAQLYRQHQGSPCILLIDDLPAELDHAHRQRVMQCLAAMPAQQFITAIEARSLDAAAWPSRRLLRFDHGRLGEMV